MAELRLPRQAYLLGGGRPVSPGLLFATGYSPPAIPAIHPIGAINFHLEIGLPHIVYSRYLNLVLQPRCTTSPPGRVQGH